MNTNTMFATPAGAEIAKKIGIKDKVLDTLSEWNFAQIGGGIFYGAVTAVGVIVTIELAAIGGPLGWLLAFIYACISGWLGMIAINSFLMGINVL